MTFIGRPLSIWAWCGRCAGPDSNRRTPLGQRPKRCAVDLAWLPALGQEWAIQLFT